MKRCCHPKGPVKCSPLRDPREPVNPITPPRQTVMMPNGDILERSQDWLRGFHEGERAKGNGEHLKGLLIGLVIGLLLGLGVAAHRAFGQTVEVPVHQPGDATGDGKVDFEDTVAVQAGWGFVGAPWTGGDADGDGRVDFEDTIAVLSNWLAGYSKDRVFVDLLHPARTNLRTVELLAACKTGVLRAYLVDKAGAEWPMRFEGGRWVADGLEADDFTAVVLGVTGGRTEIGGIRTGYIDGSGLDGWAIVEAPYPGAAWTNDPSPIPRGAQLVKAVGWSFGKTPTGDPASKKIKPRSIETGYRSLWIVNAHVEGNRDDWSEKVDLVAAGEWQGGVFLERCRFYGVHKLPADMRVIRDCRAEGVGSDAGQNARIVFNHTVIGLDKPAGSTAHPDLCQCFLANAGDTRVWWVGVTGVDIDGQGLFVRCDALDALIVRNYRVIQGGGTYKSQILRVDTRYLEMVGVNIEGQALTIGSDPATGDEARFETHLWRDVRASGGVRVDPDVWVEAAPVGVD